MRLMDRIAVVTGAASGIGAQAAVRLAGEGAKVVLVDVNRGGLEETRARIESAGGEALVCVCDVSEEAAVDAAVGQALERFGRIDILVNVAGIQVTRLLADTTKAEYDRMMDVNLGGTFLMMRKVLPLMKAQGSGAIVNCASELAFVGYRELAVYTATKGAMVSLTRSAALEAIPYGVRINCVCPGATDTPIFWEGETDPEKRRAMLEQVKIEKPIGRLITTDEVASGIIFLASDEASGVVGTCLVIDGGFTAQ
ncbi:MAG: SDR family NAD(P)-dependent oxidoreductase [Candidatus Spyradocola sp.]